MGSLKRGSIAETVRRLELWARRAPKGLALVTYVSENARQQAVVELAAKLASAGIRHREIRLPAGLPAAELTRELDRSLRAEISAVTSVIGWGEAIDGERRADRLDGLRFLGAHRERLIKSGLRQIWWMPSDLAESLAFATPDLESWILVQLELAEMSGAPLPLEPASVILRGSKRYPSLPDAQRRSARLAARYRKGLAAGESIPDLIDQYARPAVAALRQAGAEREARELEVELDVEAHRSRRILEEVAPEAKDFLISYAVADRAWAEWACWVLESAGFTVVSQNWDLRPGANFIVEMHKAVQQTRKTIVLISPDYLASSYERSEWNAALTADARGETRRLLPVRIHETEISEPLRSVVHLDLVGLDEANARAALLQAVASEQTSATTPRRPGSKPPAFPRWRSSIWNLPPRGPAFCGREGLLERLAASFRSDRPAAMVAVIGLGGVGKTRLVSEYAERYRADYKIVWFVHAYSPDAARAGLGHLAERLGLIDSERRESVAASRAALGWLADHGDWLLIYDSAGFPRDLGDWLPRGPGHLAITTRVRNWRAEARSIEISPLKAPAATELLAGRHADRDRGTAEKLADILARLPLALTVAAALAREIGSLDAVLSLLSEAPEGHGAPSKNLIKLLARWLELLRTEPMAYRVMTLGSQLSPNNIPLRWLDDSLAASASQDLGSDRTPRSAAAGLADRSLLTVRDDKAFIHPLIQAAVRAALPADQRGAALQEAVHLVNEGLDQAEWAGQQPPHHYLCHAETVALRLSEVDGMRQAAARMLDRVGSLRSLREEGATAVRLLNASIRLWESYDRAQSELVPALEHRATAHLVQGSPESARRDLQRALQIGKDLLGADHERTLDVRERLAQFLMFALNDAKGAEEHLSAVLENRRRSLGPDHPSTADALHHLGLARSRLRKLEAARRDLEQALAIRREALGAEHPDVARSLTNLGAIVAAQGDLAQALDLQRQALAILEHSLGPEHPGLLTVLMNLSGVLRHTRQLAEARDVLDRALRIARSAVDAGRADVGNIRYNLAQVSEELGDIASARDHYTAVYEAVRATAATDDPRLQELAEKIAQ